MTKYCSCCCCVRYSSFHNRKLIRASFCYFSSAFAKFLRKDYRLSGQAKKKQRSAESLSTVKNRGCQRRQENDHFPHESPSGVTVSHLRLLISLGQLFPLDWYRIAAKC